MNTLKELTLGRIPIEWHANVLRESLELGAVIFVTLDADPLDLAAFNFHCEKEGLPKISWSLRPTPLFKRPSRHLKGWKSRLEKKEPILLSFPENEKREMRRGPLSEQVLAEILRWNHERGRRVFLFPFYLFWKRRAVEKTNSIQSTIFGSPHKPSLFRKLIQLIRPHPFFSLSVLSPYELTPELSLHATELDVVAKQWRRRSLMDLIAARRVTLGPAERQSTYLVESVFDDSKLLENFYTAARDEGVKAEKVPNLILHYFSEIEAKFDFFLVEIGAIILSYLFKILFKKIDVSASEINHLKEINKAGSLILVPCHKSHVDYLLMSWLLFQNGMVPPHVAAGINLSFFPFGTFARRWGAFFIRRSFKGRLIYAEALRTYVAFLLKDRLNIEFFIEGGRSRTGRLLPPRFGLVKMIVDAYAHHELPEAYFVPVYIGYDQVLELDSYQKEMHGAQKIKESSLGLLKSISYLGRNYGKVHIRFGRELEVKKAIERFSQPSPNLVVERTAIYLSREISRESVVTSSGILALVYLCNEWKGVHRDIWIKAAIELADYFKKLGAELDEDISPVSAENMRAALHRLVEAKLVDENSAATNILYVRPKNKTKFNYFRHLFSHWLLVEGTYFISKKVKSETPHTLVEKMRSLLRFEYFLPEKHEWLARFESQNDEPIPSEIAKCLLYAFGDVLEAYRCCFILASRDLSGGRFEDEWIRTFSQGAEKLESELKVRFPEGLIATNLKTTLQFMVHEGLMEKEMRGKKVIYKVKKTEDIKNLANFINQILKRE